MNSVPNTTGSDADVWVRQLKQTEYGDINLDGDVDFDDLLVVAQNYNATTGGWVMGNIDGLSGIHFGDLLLMAQNYGFSAIDVSSDVSSFSANFVADWSRAQSMIPNRRRSVCCRSLSCWFDDVGRVHEVFRWERLIMKNWNYAGLVVSLFASISSATTYRSDVPLALSGTEYQWGPSYGVSFDH